MTSPYFTRGFTLTLLLMFVVFSLILFFSANHAYLVGITPEGAASTEEMRQAIETERQTITAQDIFVNNLSVSLILFIPLLGVFLFFVVLLNTGYIVGLLSASYNVSPLMYVVSLLTVGGWIEMTAYTFLATENIYLLYLLVTQSGAVQRIKQHSWKTAIIYIALLVAGAIWEALLLA